MGYGVYSGLMRTFWLWTETVAAQHDGCTKCHRTVYFKMVHFTLREFYLNKKKHPTKPCSLSLLTKNSLKGARTEAAGRWSGGSSQVRGDGDTERGGDGTGGKGQEVQRETSRRKFTNWDQCASVGGEKTLFSCLNCFQQRSIPI